MEWLYGNFAACPQDLTIPPNTGFERIECPADPNGIEWPWWKP